MNIQSVKKDYQATKIMMEFKEQASLSLTLKIPRTHYELWQGIKASHGLDEDFLEFVVSRAITQTIFTFMKMSEFAE